MWLDRRRSIPASGPEGPSAREMHGRVKARYTETELEGVAHWLPELAPEAVTALPPAFARTARPSQPVPIQRSNFLSYCAFLPGSLLGRDQHDGCHVCGHRPSPAHDHPRDAAGGVATDGSPDPAQPAADCG